MLVLTRQRDESVMIGDLLVTVAEIRGSRVAIAVGRSALGGRLRQFDQGGPVWLEPNGELPLGQECLCTVVDIRGDKGRLGITVPKGVSVHRKEIYDAKRHRVEWTSQVKQTVWLAIHYS